MLKVIVGLGTKNRGDEINNTCHYFTEGNAEGRGLRIRLKILETVVEVGEGVDGVHEARVLGATRRTSKSEMACFRKVGLMQTVGGIPGVE